MKRSLLTFLVILLALTIKAQIPYFAPTVGSNKLYGYTSLKFRPGINAQETYTTFQYGIGNNFATGLDLYTSGNSVYGGYLVRLGYSANKWFNIGLQLTPTFNIGNNMKFEYLTSALYLNGNITNDGTLFWTANTWYGINRDADDTVSQYLYLGKTLGLPKGQSITPMLGTIYSWEFDQDADIAFGAYWNVSKFNIYLWGNDILKKHPRIVIGIDFTF